MIIDQIQLAGDEAYLAAPGGLDLAAGPVPATGRLNIPGVVEQGGMRTLPEGMRLEMAGLHLVVESDALAELLARQSDLLFTIDIRKEMFPALFRDPFGHRVHRVGGREDFRRGEPRGIEVMEVDGVATLVSVKPQCDWSSAIYRFPRPITVVAAAWDLAASRLTDPDTFHYALGLDVWRPGQSLSSVPDSHDLAPDLTPAEARVWEPAPGRPPIGDVAAYRIRFKAEVAADAYLFERHPTMRGSLGRPLLRAIHLLEPVPHAHAFYSLGELLTRASDKLVVEADGGPPRRLTATLPLPAVLEEGEGIELTLHDDRLTRFEARLDAMLSLRPPVAEIGT